MVALDVDAFEFANGVLGQRVLIQKMPISHDDNAELRAPVANMVIRDHVVTQKAMHAVNRVSDDGRSNVPDVHRLRDIGTGVIQNHRMPRARLRNTKLSVLVNCSHRLKEPRIGKVDINESGTRDLEAVDRAMRSSPRHDLLRNRTRCHREHFRKGHCGIALIITELGVRRLDDPHARQIQLRPKFFGKC